MKNYIFIPLLLICSMVFSQETIKITYEVETKGERKISKTTSGVLPPEASRARAVARLNKKMFEWYANTRYALYKKKKQEETSGIVFSSTKTVTTSIGGSPIKKDRPFYYDEFETSLWDYKENSHTGIANIFKKDFRVNLGIEQQPKEVKITDEKKKILGYTVRKASVEYESGMTESYWFTNELKAISPYRLKGIDGVILQIDLHSKSIKAVKIDKEPSGNKVFKDFIATYEDTKVIEKDQYRDLKKEEQDENRASMRNILKGSNINLDSILKQARKQAIKKVKKN